VTHDFFSVLEQQEHELTPARAPHFGKHHFLFTVIKHYCTKALPILPQRKLELLCRAHTVTSLKMNIISYHWLPWSALFNMRPVVFQQALNILIATREGDSGVIGDDKGGTVSLDVTKLILSLFVLPPLKFSALKKRV
jgi:hypothetical protein